ncbi:uncharacterized protein NEMAJ01_1978 [Nematocida major]|uniref:uncharacterized protein n=1 Tax=Nematocida major TaxID=1912982 RepID=UPI002007D9EB|nr:uncharacterized protein NEMAJ01_1978 [Nematocida major]KAH9387082.1 hypothetical protein NEMAJ01_1978 [Nematocida major]
MEKANVRSLLLYEFKCGRSFKEAAKNINVVQSQTVSHSMASRWFLKFLSGDLSLQDQKRSGRPVKIKIEQVEEFVRKNPTATCNSIASNLGASRSTVQKQLRKLGHKKMRSKWHVESPDTQHAQ